MSPSSHMKYMLVGGAGLVLVAWLAGMPLQSALYLGILLACPLMMVLMMAGGHGQGHDHGSPRNRNDRDVDQPGGHGTHIGGV